MAIKPKASVYTLDDPEYLGYHESAKKKWAEIDQYIADQDKQLAAWQEEFNRLGPLEYIDTDAVADPDVVARNQRRTELQNSIYYYRTLSQGREKHIATLQGEAQVFETKRENRGAAVTQTGVNIQTGVAGREAVQAENLLSQNISQELTGRVARNLLQAREAQTSVDASSRAVQGRQAVLAGQAGVDVSSGTTRALGEAAASKAAADKAAIEGYRIGMQNLLMGQGEAATSAAESLTGSINRTTEDWAAKSVSAVSDVTGTLLKNVEQITGTGYFSGDARTQGVKDAEAAVDTTLDTWSLDAYNDVLNTLTTRSANRSTWEQMLLEQKGKAKNPYEQYNADISPMTPIAGTQSNLLAAAAGAQDLSNVYTLSGNKKKSGSLI